MKLLKLSTALSVLLLVALSASAQNQPGNIAALEFQTPKNGMVKQYERRPQTKGRLAQTAER